MEKIECNIIRYSLPLGFFVEIDIQGNEFGAWLYHEDYGVKDFMFGNDPRDSSLSDFLKWLRQISTRMLIFIAVNIWALEKFTLKTVFQRSFFVSPYWGQGATPLELASVVQADRMPQAVVARFAFADCMPPCVVPI